MRHNRMNFDFSNTPRRQTNTSVCVCVCVLVGEQAGEGLAEAADGFCFGLVVRDVSTQRLAEGVGERLGFTGRNSDTHQFRITDDRRGK